MKAVNLHFIKIILGSSSQCMHILLTLSHYAIPDELRPSNVGLEQNAQLSCGWNVLINGSNGRKGRNSNHQYPPAVKYLHLHECDRFSVSNLIVACCNCYCSYAFELFKQILIRKEVFFLLIWGGGGLIKIRFPSPITYAWCILVLFCRQGSSVCHLPLSYPFIIILE